MNKKACDRCHLDHREHCIDGTWVSDKRTSKSSPKKASELFIADEEAEEGEEPIDDDVDEEVEDSDEEEEEEQPIQRKYRRHSSDNTVLKEKLQSSSSQTESSSKKQKESEEATAKEKSSTKRPVGRPRSKKANVDKKELEDIKEEPRSREKSKSFEKQKSKSPNLDVDKDLKKPNILLAELESLMASSQRIQAELKNQEGSMSRQGDVDVESKKVSVGTQTPPISSLTIKSGSRVKFMNNMTICLDGKHAEGCRYD